MGTPMLLPGMIARATVLQLQTLFTFTPMRRAGESVGDYWRPWYSDWLSAVRRLNFWRRCQFLLGSQPNRLQLADCTRAWDSGVSADWKGLASSLEKFWM